jgi:hypothetical protein
MENTDISIFENNQKKYIENPGKAVEEDPRFKHVMAISLDPSSDFEKGVIRCITSRTGDLKIRGNIDRSELYLLEKNSLGNFSIGSKLEIKGSDKVIDKLRGADLDFIGLEDPDIFIDEKTGLTHLYFTMPFLIPNRTSKSTAIYLGHAVGKDLLSLEMTEPALAVDFEDSDMPGAKELSIAPINSKGFRFNLVESRKRESDFSYSTVRVAITEDMGKPWKFGETLFHPKEQNIPWIGGHASPGPLFPESFIDLGVGKRLGIMNGREANKKVGNETIYGMFSVGLFIYDYENGKIDWVSEKPFIKDSQAKTITFASQFVETEKETGIIYAHVDDSFVRAYTVNAEEIKTLLPR